MAHVFAPTMIPARENADLGVLATLTAEGAGTVTLPNQYNAKGCGIAIVVNITNAGTAPTLLITLQGFDPGSGQSYSIAALASITANGVYSLVAYPGLPVLATGNNQTANVALPPSWNIKYVVAGTTPSFTGTISASVIAS